MGLTVRTFLGAKLQEEAVHLGQLPEDGASQAIGLDSARSFDRMTLTIRREHLNGLFEGSEGAAVAEIEVIARVAESTSTATAGLILGDSNCDLTVDISDPVRVLSRLFSGDVELCCRAAADTNQDGLVDISDPVGILDRLFSGAESPTGKGPTATTCRTLPTRGLGCSEETCP